MIDIPASLIVPIYTDLIQYMDANPGRIEPAVEARIRELSAQAELAEQTLRKQDEPR